MDISPELVSLIVDSTNKAIPSVQNTNGPLLSFVTIEAADGMRGDKDFPSGTNSYVHADTNTHIKVTLVYRENAFLPVEFVELNSAGATSDLRDDLRSQILAVYQT